MASPVDVGGLPNHVKYCVSVLSLQWANIRTSPVGIPYNWYQSWWFKVVFDFCSKLKVVKIKFWPYHCVEEEETKPLVKTASKSDVENGRKRHHAPVSRLPTRLLHPDGLTLPEYQMTRPTRQTWIRMASAWRHHAQLACHVSWHVIIVGPTSHVISREPSWSRAASRGIGSNVADSTCNRIWDWIWAVNQAKIVLIKS